MVALYGLVILYHVIKKSKIKPLNFYHLKLYLLIILMNFILRINFLIFQKQETTKLVFSHINLLIICFPLLSKIFAPLIVIFIATIHEGHQIWYTHLERRLKLLP